MSKEPTPKQIAARKAQSDRLKARHAAARAAKAEQPAPEPSPPQEPVITSPEPTTTQPDFSAAPTETVADNNSNDDLLRRVLELQAQLLQSGILNQAAPQASGPQVQNGKLTGTVEKFSLDAKRYADPVSRLSAEPRLQRFAFPINYELQFDISQTSYTTIDNVRQIEPKFTLKLIKKIIDEYTGDDTKGRYVITSMVFFEDPETAIIMARDNGIDIDESNEAAFLDEMRYLRMRDWLLDAFYPRPPKQTAQEERVIDNRVVSFYEVNNETGDINIPFDKMTRYKV